MSSWYHWTKLYKVWNNWKQSLFWLYSAQFLEIHYYLSYNVHRIFRSPDFYFKSIFASIPNHKQIIYQLIRHTRNDLTTKSTWKERQLSRSNTYWKQTPFIDRYIPTISTTFCYCGLAQMIYRLYKLLVVITFSKCHKIHSQNCW